MAAKVTIAEVDELVEPGEIAPEMIATPGIYVHRIVVTTPPPAPSPSDGEGVTGNRT